MDIYKYILYFLKHEVFLKSLAVKRLYKLSVYKKTLCNFFECLNIKFLFFFKLLFFFKFFLFFYSLFIYTICIHLKRV